MWANTPAYTVIIKVHCCCCCWRKEKNWCRRVNSPIYRTKLLLFCRGRPKARQVSERNQFKVLLSSVLDAKFSRANSGNTLLCCTKLQVHPVGRPLNSLDSLNLKNPLLETIPEPYNRRLQVVNTSLCSEIPCLKNLYCPDKENSELRFWKIIVGQQ